MNPELGSVRRRPGMYVGSTTDGSGLHHLLWEIVGNVVDLHLQRYATEVRAEIDGEWVTVRDDGPGIPISPIPPTNVSVLETVFTTLHAGATFDGHRPHVHLARGMGGAGLAPVNALCARLEVETTRDGERWAQTYERGVPTGELRNLGSTLLSGTAIRFRPDPEIFGGVALDVEQVEARLVQLAWLNPLLRVFVQDRRLADRGGIAVLAAQLAGTPAITYATCESIDGVSVDLALAWGSSRNQPVVRGFVNMHETPAGSHIDGIWSGLAELAVSTSGLVAIVHVGLYAPHFAGPQRVRLDDPRVATVVARIVATGLSPQLVRDLRPR